MTHQFISPNWHPLLIHYPLGFLSAGILIEILSFMWPRGFFRAAGRWMILLGALLTLPALAAGLYAFKSILGGHGAWHDIVRESGWTKQQWEYMRLHLLLNCIGCAVIIIAVITWIADSDVWRRRLYFPVLLALIGGMALFAVAGWYGGESVYRFGAGVQSAEEQTAVEPAEHDITYFVPPMQLHIVLAGLAVAIGLGSLALTIRRLEPPEEKLEPAETIGPTETAVAADAAIEPVPVAEVPIATVTPDVPSTVPAVASHPYPVHPPLIHAGRFWMLTFLAVLCTAAAGLWSVVNVFTSERLTRNWNELTHPDGKYRLILHAIFGVSLLLLPLILAGLARFGRRRRGFTGAFILLILIAIGIQVWLGIALYYDGGKGPIYRFTPVTPPAALP